jgi:hypothetical protein
MRHLWNHVGDWAFPGCVNPSNQMAWHPGTSLPLSRFEVQDLPSFIGAMSKGEKQKYKCRIRQPD